MFDTRYLVRVGSCLFYTEHNHRSMPVFCIEGAPGTLHPIHVAKNFKTKAEAQNVAEEFDGEVLPVEIERREP